MRVSFCSILGPLSAADVAGLFAAAGVCVGGGGGLSPAGLFVTGDWELCGGGVGGLSPARLFAANNPNRNVASQKFIGLFPAGLFPAGGACPVGGAGGMSPAGLFAADGVCASGGDDGLSGGVCESGVCGAWFRRRRFFLRVLWLSSGRPGRFDRCSAFLSSSAFVPSSVFLSLSLPVSSLSLLVSSLSLLVSSLSLLVSSLSMLVSIRRIG